MSKQGGLILPSNVTAELKVIDLVCRCDSSYLDVWHRELEIINFTISNPNNIAYSACILRLNSLVEDDEAFGDYKGRWNKRSSILHVMVFLKYLGSYGDEAILAKIGRAMGIFKGAVNDCVMQACSAILKLQKGVIKWPDEEERKVISARIKHAHGFANCVG